MFGLAATVAQFVGPSRPELLGSSGELTLTTTSPIPGEASYEATCESDAEGTEMTLGGNFNMRLEVWEDGDALPPEESLRVRGRVHRDRRPVAGLAPH